jgi:UDP-N-acetylglucosamine--N-acetylmuramyl-(pentapeptide) pyrophosphoryl-undecaprenol N-acetylglucosamine transferase
VKSATNTALRVMIAGGGTGGHVVPALAIGKALREQYGAEVRFVGTSRGLETRLVPENGFRLELVRSGQWNHVGLTTKLRTAMDLPLGVLHCVGLLRAFKPGVVVGVGGYASGPAMIAAVLLRLPTLVYEPNAMPGLTNRKLGRLVSAAAVNFPQTARYFRHAEVTGVPVRPEMFAIPALTGAEAPRLLVTAGSNGAKVFNDVLPKIMPQLLEAVPGLTVMHQTGPRSFAEASAAYAMAGVSFERVQVVSFLSDMPQQLEQATLVLARSGSTVAELAASGRPSLLVPFPQAADDHQRGNAEVLVRAGAAQMLLQPEATEARLLAELTAMLNDRARLVSMGTQARSLARPQALERMTAMIAELGGEHEAAA